MLRVSRNGAVTVVPSPPVFPNSFYAGIESTHITNGYSRYGSEAYSQSCDAVSFAFYNSDVGFKRIIGDYKNQKVWHITSPNATFANGVCWNEPMADRPEFVEGEGGGLVTTAKFLGFVNTNGNEATYMPEGAKAIRCAYMLGLHPRCTCIFCSDLQKLGISMFGETSILQNCFQSINVTLCQNVALSRIAYRSLYAEVR